MARTEEGYEPQPGRRTGRKTLGQAAGELPAAQRDDGGEYAPPAEHKTQWAADFAQEYRTAQGARAVRVSENWDRMLPPGSKWQPGLLGKPDCAMCLGMGFVSADLPLGHPKQGKLMYCECRRRDDYPRLKSRKQLEAEAAATAD